MRYVAAYLLAVMGGNESPTAADLERIIHSVDIATDPDKIKRIIDNLKGKSPDDVIAQGREKLSVILMPKVEPGHTSNVDAAEKMKEKEVKKEVSETESDEETFCFGLFD